MAGKLEAKTGSVGVVGKHRDRLKNPPLRLTRGGRGVNASRILAIDGNLGA